MKKFSTILLLVILLFVLLPMAVFAQEETPPEAVALLPIPAVLLGLMALNNRITETVKLYLSAEKLPFTPTEPVRRFIVLLVSMGVGIVSAAFTPDALSWLGAEFGAYPIPAILITGVAVSLGAGAIQMILSVLQSFRRDSTVYETTTKVSTPNVETSQKTASETLAVASQAVDSGKG